MKKRRAVRRSADAELPDPYLEHWRSLTPAERLRRAWNLRKRVKNLRAIHVEKTFPEL